MFYSITTFLLDISGLDAPLFRLAHLPWRTLAILSFVLVLLTGSSQATLAQHNSQLQNRFSKQTLSESFHSEGAAVADINNDGIPDLISGPFWYRGPSFQKEIRYLDGDPLSIKGYSEHFFTWTFDFNRDGAIDLLTVGMPGEPAYWFENPGATVETNNSWKKHKVIDEASGESPAFTDVNGDGRPELICIHKGSFGFVESKLVKQRVNFSFTPMTPNKGLGRFTHGMGVGDVNGDERLDLIETQGWWEQPKRAGELFKFHPYRFAQSGGAQMFAYDFDGDGKQDILSSQNAHGFGLTWFRQVSSEAGIDFNPIPIMTDKTSENPFGLAISQMHAISLADIDGDGIKDVVTGKRFWAHGGADPGAKELPVLFWLKTQRRNGRVRFEPNLIDARSGVGTQLTVADINLDKKPDVIVGNKLGTFLFINEPDSQRAGNRPTFATVPMRAGTDQFNENVRTSQPLTPQDQAKTFVLPQGFEIQLVAAEPDIAKPMNMAFDKRGRLWVSSSLEYPFAAKEGESARDSIKILEDQNGDGYAEKVTTFADGLNIPMGLIPYKDGVICFSIPNIWFLRDTNGDGKADSRKVLYGPFDTSRDTHGMCSSFTLGNDGWIYACHGYNNESKVKGTDGHWVEMSSGNVFRFRPDGSRIEIVTRGQVNPFGMTASQFGDLFSADCHTKPINLVLNGGNHDSFGRPHDGLGYIPNIMEHLHDSTGIGGIVLGENTNFPGVYRKSTFGGNVVTGRINRNEMLYSGSSPIAREEPDFLIPGDPWFRPVNLQTGPDGSLYIADFYNAIIGHYEVDLDHPKRDRTRGRIWRIVYSHKNSDRTDERTNFAKPKKLSKLSIPELLAELGSSAPTCNLTYTQGILGELENRMERNADAGLRDRLVELVESSDGNLVHAAIVLLHRQNKLPSSKLLIAAKHANPHVRCGAFAIMSDYQFANSELGGLKSTILKGLSDPQPIVRRFAAMTCGKQTRPDLALELVQLLNETGPSDPQLRHAIKIALREQFRFKPERLLPCSSQVAKGSIISFAGICRALKTPESVDFLVDNLDHLSEFGIEKLEESLEMVARNASPKSLDLVAKVVQSKFANDQETQVKILKSIHAGLSQRGEKVPGSVRAWASGIAKEFLSEKWNAWQMTDSGGAETPFSVWLGQSEDRSSVLLFRSGEKLTGKLESKPFVLDESFSFYIAGHDGQPKSPLSGKNYVRLVLAGTNEEIARSSAPRNDAAKRVSWVTEKFKGKPARFEIVDQNSGSGFAWIAAGQFSAKDLNPRKDWNPNESVEPLGWNYFSDSKSRISSPTENIYFATTRRLSADGMKSTPLWSSIVNGEQKMGVFKSEPFIANSTLTFYMAGHDGVPDKPRQKLNFAQLRLVESNQILAKTFAPRNDTAQKIFWDLKKWKGQLVSVELVDGDGGGAYAWLAAGRFSNNGLNPSETSKNTTVGAELVGHFQLAELREVLVERLRRSQSQSSLDSLSQAILSLDSNEYRSASIFQSILLVMKVGDREVQQQAKTVLINIDQVGAQSLLAKFLETSPSRIQNPISVTLAGDLLGAQWMMSQIEAGKISPQVLLNQLVATKLQAYNDQDLNEKKTELTKNLESIDVKMLKLMNERLKTHFNSRPNMVAGKKLFEKNCSNCHRIGMLGKQIGPNLDGIGNRGLDRLIEDVLLPNRNVDKGFRASIVRTYDGKVFSGSVKKGSLPENTKLVLIETTGKQILIEKSEIEEQSETLNSPMPNNLAQLLNENEFRDLIGFLMSKPASNE